MSQIFTNVPFLITLAIILPGVVASLAVAWQKVRKAEAQTALKQAMLDRGMSADEIARVLYPPEVPELPLSEEAAFHAFGECLAGVEIEGSTLETLAATFRAADLATKRALVQTLKGITDGGGELTEDWILPLVRGLCGNTASGTSTGIRPAREPGVAV